MAEFSLPRHTLTKAEHDALMAHRQRPLTDDPIRLRRATPQLPNPAGSPIDPIIDALEEQQQ